MSRPPARALHLDLLKAGAAQLIVLHHFAAYGPLPRALSRVAPGLVDWLFEYARMAVQVFLVMGGYLAARSLASALAGQRLLPVIANRHLRLAGPMVVALILAILAAAVARPVLGEEFIPEAPGLAQFVAHALLLQGVLGFESLSSGVWYVAIDFQLYALLAILLTVGRHAPRLRGLLVAMLAVLSAFFFNLQSQHDHWAPYFWAAYGLGVCAYWAREREAGARILFWGLVTLVVVSLEMNFRARLGLATVTALVLMLWPRQAPVVTGPFSRLIAWLGKTSYALFLVHFPMLLLASALYGRLGSNSVSAAVALLVAAWAASMALSALFHRRVEIPLGRLSWRRRATQAHTPSPVEPRPVPDSTRLQS